MEGTKADGAPEASGFLHELRRPYKAGQGLVTRRIAMATGAGFSVWGSWDLWGWLQGFSSLKEPMLPGTPVSHLPFNLGPLSASVLIAAVVALAGCAFTAWYLQRRWLADLLIETESEMKKVSWPAGSEAWNATKVVAATVLVFTLVLMVFDSAITKLLTLLTGLPL